MSGKKINKEAAATEEVAAAAIASEEVTKTATASSEEAAALQAENEKLKAALATKEATLTAQGEIIKDLHEQLKGYEDEKKRLEERMAVQDERIEKVMGIISLRAGKRRLRPLKRAAIILGRLIIFSEEVLRKKKEGVLFSSLSLQEQEQIVAAAPHIFQDVVTEETNSVTA